DLCSGRRAHTRLSRDWSSDVCSSDLERGPDPTPMTQVTVPQRLATMTRAVAPGWSDREIPANDDGMMQGVCRMGGRTVALPGGDRGGPGPNPRPADRPATGVASTPRAPTHT